VTVRPRSVTGATVGTGFQLSGDVELVDTKLAYQEVAGSEPFSVDSADRGLRFSAPFDFAQGRLLRQKEGDPEGTPTGHGIFAVHAARLDSPGYRCYLTFSFWVLKISGGGVWGP